MTAVKSVVQCSCILKIMLSSYVSLVQAQVLSLRVNSKNKYDEETLLNTNKQNKLCGRPPQYAPAPYKLTFDRLTLKVVSESHVTWATSVPILVFLGLSVLDLGPMYATDRRQTDFRHASSLNASALWGRGIITVFISWRIDWHWFSSAASCMRYRVTCVCCSGADHGNADGKCCSVFLLSVAQCSEFCCFRKFVFYISIRSSNSSYLVHYYS